MRKSLLSWPRKTKESKTVFMKSTALKTMKKPPNSGNLVRKSERSRTDIFRLEDARLKSRLLSLIGGEELLGLQKISRKRWKNSVSTSKIGNPKTQWMMAKTLISTLLTEADLVSRVNVPVPLLP